MSAKHTCSLIASTRYTKGKDKEGCVRAICDQGDYASSSTSPQRAARMGRAHERAKNINQADLKASIARHPSNYGF